MIEGEPELESKTDQGLNPLFLLAELLVGSYWIFWSPRFLLLDWGIIIITPASWSCSCWFANLTVQRSPLRSCEPQILGSNPRVFWFSRFGVGLRICICNRFQDDALAAGPGTSLWGVLVVKSLVIKCWLLVVKVEKTPSTVLGTH